MPQCDFQAFPVDGSMAFDKCFEDTVKQKKADAEIRVHVPRIIEAVMVNIMEAPSFSEPPVYQGRARHPVIAEMHRVVQQAEAEERPDKKGAEYDGLIDRQNAKQQHHTPT